MSTPVMQRAAAMVGNRKPHLLKSEALGKWLCVGKQAIGQGNDEGEAFDAWFLVAEWRCAGKRHSPEDDKPPPEPRFHWIKP